MTFQHMKDIYKIICALVLMYSITSCDSYLDSDSADLQIPKAVEDYSPLLLGEGYPVSIGDEGCFFELMTDDVEMGPLQYDPAYLADTRRGIVEKGVDAYNAGYGIYAHAWTDDYSRYWIDKYWNSRYHNILTCNTIIDALPTMEDRDTKNDLYQKLAYQAYALRAFNYFCLINTYAKPYSPNNFNEPGVILKTQPEVGIATKGRATIKEVYDLIDSDLEKAEQYMEGANRLASKFEFTRPAVLFLATRVALFEGDWDKVIEKGLKFFKMNRALDDLSTYDVNNMGVNKTGEAYYYANDVTHDEVVWAFSRGTIANITHKYLSGGNSYRYEVGFHTSWTNENSLIQLYEEGDLRKEAYYLKLYIKSGSTYLPNYQLGQYYPNKCNYSLSTSNRYSRQAWRTSEIYISLAEAYAQKGDTQNALKYLNQLRVKRFAANSQNVEKSASDFSSKADLIKYIWDERRRELSFEENMRLWDMRRQGMPAQIHYIYNSLNDFVTYQLPQGSRNYVMPIPESELNYNEECVNNPRDIIAGK